MELASCSTCDIADAMQRLHARPCFISTASRSFGPQQRICGPAHTITVALASSDRPKRPTDAPHHIDCAVSGCVIVVRAPPTAVNAVFGGLLATRAQVLRVQGVIVEGRIRDIAEIRGIGLPVWASGTSTMGAAPHCKVVAVGEPLKMCGDTILPVDVRPGDIIVADEDGVVCVPVELVWLQRFPLHLPPFSLHYHSLSKFSFGLPSFSTGFFRIPSSSSIGRHLYQAEQVAKECARSVQVDERVKADLVAGTSLRQAFNAHRG
ncbi:MAG: hypothetical protein SGCHY_004569 [Lobulomycetales sp.]